MRRRTVMTAAAGALLGLVAGPAGAEPGRCTVGQLLELKVTMAGMKPMVSVGINGHDERFVADSGAFYSSISSGKAAELGLHLEPMPVNYVVKGIGGEVHPSLATVRSVDLAGVPLHDVRFIVGGSEIGNGAGLLGQNVLGIGDVEYDLAHGAVRLLRPHDCGKAANLAYWASSRPVSTVTILPRDANNPHTVGFVTVNGVRLRAVFDTGASGTVMTMKAAARLGLSADSPGVTRAGFGHGIGRNTVAAYVLPIDSIKLGDQEEIRRTHIRAEASEFSDDDMLIGADFFLSHRVYVANAMHRLFFTYDGGPIFNVTPTRIVDKEGGAVQVAADDTAAPTDAAGYSRRGAAFLARHDAKAALADLDRAVALAPTEGRYLYQRAQAHVAARQPLLAMDDLDQALRIDPANGEARLARASVRLGRHDRAAAEEDVAAIDRSAAPAADVRLALAEMYGALDRFDSAIDQYDLWLRYHPDDSRRPTALNGRCWTRAERGVDLAKALSDCDQAIKARPAAASYLDSRGLVRLRLGDNDKAIRDYDAALAIAPRSAWSLYGRGLAKERLGDKAAGQKDIDAAVAIDAHLPERAKALGVS